MWCLFVCLFGFIVIVVFLYACLLFIICCWLVDLFDLFGAWWFVLVASFVVLRFCYFACSRFVMIFTCAYFGMLCFVCCLCIVWHLFCFRFVLRCVCCLL